MSSRQLEEAHERRRNEMLAAALGTTREELEAQDWEIDESTTGDGAAVGYIVTFAEGTDPNFLEQVGAADSGWITVSINVFDEPDE